MAIVRKALVCLLALGLMSGGFMGCTESDDDDDNDDISEALPLPPPESMTMDFTAFNGDKMAPGADPPGENFKAAAGRVVILNVAVLLNLAPSVKVFKDAIGVVPTEEEDGSWTWGYTSKYLMHTFDATLNGRMVGFSTEWSMRVSGGAFEVPLENFLWYTGEVELNNSSGSWRFFDYKTPDIEREIGTIEWEVKDSDTSNLMFSNTDPESPDYGDVLTYSVDGEEAEISYYNADEDLESEIVWNVNTLAGSIMVPGYNNGERAYWDENLQDVD
jgi:hypothetical protein